MIRLLSAVNKIILICLIVSISTGAAVGSAFYDSGDDKDFSERKYAPDRKVDILHITIDVTPDFNQRTIEGITTIKFTPIAKPLYELRLDAYDLLVSSVGSSAEIAGYNVTEEDITITFASAIEPTDVTTVTIAYHAEPKDGFFFRTPELGYKPEDIHLFTQGESHSHRYWFPNYDYPNEHSTSEVICHVPSDMTVLANGRLVSEVINHDTGLKTVCWKQEKPHVNYLIALVAGKFEKVESKHKDIPLAFYTTPSNIKYAQNSFRETADIMDFYEKEIGVDFPWCKYYQVCVADFVAGGMENTSLTILTEGTLFSDEFENVRSSRGLNSHEMAHQWFGDYVTCKDWSHLWLNEGFATYYEKLHDGHQNGRDQMLYNLYDTAAGILGETEEQRPIVYKEYSDEGEQFDYRNYNKGCWVLHMLRNRLGEDLYRKCVKTYLERFAFSSAVTEDFVSIIEELSGRSYDRFFDEWVRQGRFPELKVSYSWSEKDKLVKVSVTQTQKPVNNVKIYHFPASIRFVVNGRKIDKEINVDAEEHDFYFPLPAKPEIVRFDPEYTLLAKIEFNKPREMLYAQLEDTNDVIGRILAIDQLEEKNDKTTIEKLKKTLNNDPFYGVRIKACDALLEMKDEEAAFKALCDSIEQPDARVRRSVLGSIGSVYGKESHEIILDVIETEKNPDIKANCLRHLALYRDDETKQIMKDYLKSESFKNLLADAAIVGIHKLDDPCFIDELKETIKTRFGELETGTIGSGLATLAYIAREQEDTSCIREFLTGYVEHKNPRIKAAALRALGTLGDVKARALLESFAPADEMPGVVPRRRRFNSPAWAAKDALDKLNKEQKFAPAEVIELREKIDELKKETEKTKEELEDLKKRFEARQKESDSNDISTPADSNEPPKEECCKKLIDANQPADANN